MQRIRTAERMTAMTRGRNSTKQMEILEYIKREILEKGYPPTVREICEEVNLKSISSVHSHLESLEKYGYIRRDPTKPRAIEICDDSFQMVRTEMVSVPVVGRVAAGEPILADQNIESYFPIPAENIPSGTSFALKVHGDSMINAGIFDGDLIFVSECNQRRDRRRAGRRLRDREALLQGEGPHPPAARERRHGPHSGRQLRHPRQSVRRPPLQRQVTPNNLE